MSIDLHNRWMNSAAYLAQAAHFLGAVSGVLAFAAFFGLAHVWIPLVGGVAAAALKEFWYDATYELPKQTWKDNLLDFCFYALGMAVGTIVAVLAVKYGRLQG